MTVYFITLHPGAIVWARRKGLKIARLVNHLDPSEIRPGDTVIGTLPLFPSWELADDEIEKHGARTEKFFGAKSGDQ